MGWLIALGILAALALLPVGARVVYNRDGFTLRLLLGAVKIPLNLEKSQKKEKPEKKKAPQKASSQKKEEEKGGSWQDFLPLLKIALRFIGKVGKRLRVRRLEAVLTMAGDDPCDLAVNYGKAWAAVGSLMPALNALLVIKKQNVQVRCDFTGEKTTFYAAMDITITLGWAVALIVKYGFLLVREYLRILNLRKGGN